jgi:rare lipoprotein A
LQWQGQIVPLQRTKISRMRLLILSALFTWGTLGAQAQDSSCTDPVSNQEVKKEGNIFSKYLDGIASYYHARFEGRKTANGEIFDNDKFTAASNKLKLGSYVKVTNLSNKEVVYVKINDRMANNGRVIDLAQVAAEKLDFKTKGLTKVKVEVVPAEEGKQGILAQNTVKEPEQKNEL